MYYRFRIQEAWNQLTIVSGILSGYSHILAGQHTPQNNTIQASTSSTRIFSAKIYLNSAEYLENIPESTRSIFINSIDEFINVAKLNYFKVAKAINSLGGSVDQVDHMKSGSLLITTKTLQQVHTILKAKATDDSIPIKSTIVWTNLLSYGRIYAEDICKAKFLFGVAYNEARDRVNKDGYKGNNIKSHMPIRDSPSYLQFPRLSQWANSSSYTSTTWAANMPATGRALEVKNHTTATQDTSRSQTYFSSSFITPGQRSPKQSY